MFFVCLKLNFWLAFWGTESVPRPIQSISYDVHPWFCVSVCVFVTSAGTQNRKDWRLLVKESFSKIAKLRNLFSLHRPLGRFSL